MITMHYDELFPSLPDEARAWVYVASARLSPAQQEMLSERLDAFFDRWTSHSRAVTGDAVIVGDRILLVSGHVDGGVSGCGIDSSVQEIRSAGSEAGIEWIDPLNIVYRKADDTVEVAPRPVFRERVRGGEIGPETHVFDLSVTTLGAIRQGHLERPAHESWHARVFQIPHAA